MVLFRDQMYDLASGADIYRLNMTLRDLSFLTAEDAEQIFAGFDRTGLDVPESAQLIFDVCGKSAFTLPEMSYHWTLRLWERFPAMLSSEGALHPGYVYRASEQRTFARCPICGGKGVPYYRGFSYGMVDFHYPFLLVKLWMRCGSCENLYTWQYPEEQLALSFHMERLEPDPERYWSTTQKTDGHQLGLWCETLERLQSYTEGDSLLEVGVGTGELLAVAQEAGFSVDAVEIEAYHAQRVADMLDIPVWNGDFLALDTERRYDVITMGDVIEHIVDPAGALRNAYRLLKDDGFLWLSTSNYESSYSRMMKFQDAMWQEPTHISYFSFRGLRALAGQSGFLVQDYRVSKRYNGSMELILVKNPEENVESGTA